MTDIAIVVSNDNKNVTPFETIDAIKKAGFKNVFIQWYEPDCSFVVPQKEVLKKIKEEKLNVVFAHLGYKKINDIWLEDERGDVLKERYIKDLRECKKNGINMVVMHLHSKWDPPLYSDKGLERIKEICLEAIKLDMYIAFENTKLLRYVSWVLKNIEDKHIGVCVDVGHLHCNSKDRIDFSRWQNRILAVHLHDNNGEDDLHMIPKEGNIDWEFYLKGLKNAGYQSYLTFEQCTKHYDNISLDEFYKRSYERALELANYYDSIE